MISRKTAKAIAEAYYEKFSSTRWTGRSSESEIYKDELYDFLYEHNFAGWLLNAIKGIYYTNRRRIGGQRTIFFKSDDA